MKNVAIIGGGISGVFSAIRIKERHPDYKVTIFEHNDKLLKKIYATGNGKCNFANKGGLKGVYKNEEFALPIINSFNSDQIVSYFEKIGIKTKSIGDLLYPYSESAETVANHLLKRIKELNVEVQLNVEVKDYQKGQLETSLGTFPYDALIISVGGKSSPNLGSNGSFFETLAKHGYQFVDMNPSLCPIKTKENTKMVEGLRHKVNVKLYQSNKLIHEEDGELLFKKDGLSGMVIFNMTHYINLLSNTNNITLHIDFAKDIEGDYESLLNPKLANYLQSNKLNIHDVVYTFKGFYEYQNSQVTSGGISIKDINNDLSSKKESSIYFLGEVVDVDAICGGYNIMWALASAEKVSQNL